MRRYWFDDTLLTAAQIQQCLDDAIAFAGPRYTSMLDVVTNAHVGLDFFGGTGDFCEWYETSLTPIVRVPFTEWIRTQIAGYTRRNPCYIRHGID
jgi:hypothetical protein